MTPEGGLELLGPTTWTVLGTTALFGAAAGAVGSFALLRRRALFADTIGHATLPGVLVAFLGASALGLPARAPLLLLAGAALGALTALALGQDLLRRTRLDSDAVIGSLGGAAFGLGLVLLGLAQDLGGTETAGLDHLIFGSAASLTRSDVGGMAALAGLSALLLLGLWPRLAALAFDEPFARTAGLAPARLDAALLGMLLLVTLSGLRAVGMILVVAMLVLPPIAARLFCRDLRSMVALAAVLGALSSAAGTLASGLIERVPTGPAIVLAAAVPVLIGFLFSPDRGLLAGLRRRRFLRTDALTRLAAERSARAHRSPQTHSTAP